MGFAPFIRANRSTYFCVCPYLELEARIKVFTSLRLEALDRLSLQNKLLDIGKLRTEADQGAAS